MDPEAIAGRFRRQERLAVGGMTEVWSAGDTEPERKLVNKLPPPAATTLETTASTPTETTGATTTRAAAP